MNLLRQGLASRDLADAVECLTVDKYQGRDKAVIIISFVRSNPNRLAGKLLADWQRVNVALTRAKVKLVLIGSASTLASVPLLGAMLKLLTDRGWVVPLPSGALAVGDGRTH